MSPIAGIMLNDKSLKPLLFSPNGSRPRDLNAKAILTQFRGFQAPEGHLTKHADGFDFREILMPHVTKQREKIGTSPASF
jgi:hypothetical protein